MSKFIFGRYLCSLYFKILINFLCVSILILLLVNPALGNQIVTDGLTSTSVNKNDNVTTIKTKTIQDSNAFNSFKKFNVIEGNTVNLIIPDNTSNLINLIHSERSIISGTVNCLQNDQIGGNVYFVNPFGLTLSKNGIINVGSLTITSPTKDFTDNFFLAPGHVNKHYVDSLFNDSYTINPEAVITIEGSINAIENVKLDTGSINVSGHINTGTLFSNDPDTNDIVNTSNISSANKKIIENGEIYLKSLNDCEITGELMANNLEYGNILLSSKQNIILGKESQVIASGKNNSINIDGKFVSLGGTIDNSGLTGGNINIISDNLSLAGKLAAIGSQGKGGNISLITNNNVWETSSSLVDASGIAGGTISNIADKQLISSGKYYALGYSGSGGNIYLSGNNVKLLSSNLDASGLTQGGQILIGGEFQGGKNLDLDVIPNAETLIINDTSKISASATGSDGSGGRIISWADEYAAVLGEFTATPGLSSGKGGFVEVSSGDKLVFRGKVNTGINGEFLLDPKNITIADTGYNQQALIIGNNYTSPNIGISLDDNDQFGYSVSIDGNQLAIGANWDDGSGDTRYTSGSVYLYTFTDSNFSGASLEGIIGYGYTGGKNVNQSLDNFDFFGSSVSLDSNRLAVGAINDDGFGNVDDETGAVYLYSFTDSSFSGGNLEAIIGDSYVGGKNINVPLDIFDSFGYSVALNGNQLAIGAIKDDGSGNITSNTGAVYLYTFADASFNGGTLQAMIGEGYAGGKDINLNLDDGDFFGSSLSLENNNLAIGAINNDGSTDVNPNSGAVYIYSFADNVFTGGNQELMIGSGYAGGKNINQTLDNLDNFGSSVSLYNRILAVGASGDDASGNAKSNTGAVYLYSFADFNFNGGTLDSTIGDGYTGSKNVDVTLDDDDFFGTSVAFEDTRLAIGAYGDDGSGNVALNTGAVYLLNLFNDSVSSVDQYAESFDSDVTISIDTLLYLLSNAQNTTLQANNDITLSNNLIVNNIAGNGGILTLQAGRSININANITTDNANLNLYANDLLANGVVDTERDAGNAVVAMAPGTTIEAGSGNVEIDLRSGAGKTNLDSGNITLNNINAETILVTNNGSTTGSNVVINNTATLNAAGNANPLVLSTVNGNFINNDDGNALQAAADRWLVYSSNPASTTPNGLVYNKIYNSTYAGNPPATIPAGDYILYSTAPVLDVTAEDKSKLYGDAIPALTYVITGFIDGDTVLSGTSGAANITTAATNASPTGSYVIDSAQGTLASSLGYQFNFVDGNLTVNSANLTVTVNDDTKNYGDANPAFTAGYAGFVLGEDSSVLGGSISSTATVSSAVGTYPITASTLTSSNYNIIPIDGTLTVDPANLTVTVNDGSKLYGDAVPALTANYAGFVLGEDESVLGGSITTTATQTSNVGAYPITAGTLTSTNYNIIPVDGTLTVNPAGLTVTADDTNKTYGSANPAFTASYGGFVLGEDPSVLGGALAFNTPATNASNVGDYAITPSGLTSTNYNINFVDGTLSVNTALLTVTANDAAKTYGDPNPAFSENYSGFVLGQDPSVLGGAISFSTPATNSSDAGNYSITPSGLTSTNYSFNYVDGTLTINPANLVATVNDTNKNYGDLNPAFTANYAGFVLGQDETVLGGSITSTATQSSNVGAYPITANTLTSTNYNITSVDGTLTVDPTNLTVTADNTSKSYGSTNPAFTANYTGFVLGEDQSVLGGTLAFNTPANDASVVGNYTITPSGLTSTNYNIAFANGILTVNPANLTVTANDANKFYGDANPAFSASYNGFVLGQDETVLGGTLAFTTPATSVSDAGGYNITPSGLTSTNYAINFADGTLTINPANLTVTVNDTNKIYGSANPAFSANYAGFVLGQDESVLGGSISSTATISSDAGNYPITASTLTSSNYNIISVDGTLAINPAALTATVNDANKTYGDANPAFTANYAGFVLGQDETVLGGSITSTATQSSNVGAYPITANTLTSTNYNITSIDGSLTVDPASLTVTADDKSKTYGSSNPAFTANYSGFVLGQDETSLGGTLAFSTTANDSSVVGNYPITPSGLTSTNYNISFANGALTVDPAPLTVTVDDLSKIYGDANPSLTASYSGFVLGEDASVLGGSLTTTATATSNAGNYPITGSALTATNYNITSIDGTLTVDPADLTVTVNNASKTYGDANPALTANYSGFVLGEDQSVLGGSITTTATTSSNAGNYSVTGSTLTSNNYNIISNDGTLTIDPAPLTVVVNDQNKTYGDPNPALTANYTGFVLGEDSSVLGGSITTIATASSDAGNYAITGSTLTSTDYNISATDGTMTIVPASLQIAANNTNKTYGDPNPAFSASYTGFVLGQDQSALSGSINYNTASTTSSPAGVYSVTPAGLSSTNYNISYIDGSLTVDPAALTVRANNTSKVYGSGNPAFSSTITGFVLGENSSVLGGNLSYLTTATASSNVGTYNISPSGLTSTNYVITYLNGSLTVDPASLIVTADDKSKTFGDSNPEFTASYNGFVLGQNSSSLSGNLSFSTTASNFSDPGNYPIAPSGLLSSNYDIEYVDGTLTINELTSSNIEKGNSAVEILDDEVQQTTSSAITTEANIESTSNESLTSTTNINNNFEVGTTESEIEISLFETNESETTQTSSNSTTTETSSGNIGTNETSSTEETANNTESNSDTNNSSTSNNSNSSGQATKKSTGKSSSWVAIKKSIDVQPQDEPVMIESPEVMRTIFDLCQGQNNCEDITTPENVSLMENAIYLNLPELELEADSFSSEFLSLLDYHPAGLIGYLKTVQFIEKIKKLKEGKDSKNKLSKKSTDFKSIQDSLSHRHPNTNIRIQQIDKEISQNDLRHNSLLRLNKSSYQKLIQNSNGELDLTPKVKKAIKAIQRVTSKNEYYDAQD